MNSELDELSRALKVTLEENTVVVFKVPRSECRRVGESLNGIGVFKRYNITPLACPNDYEIVVIHPRE